MADSIEQIVANAENRMKKAISVLRDEFLTIRTGRASTALLDRVMIDYYGSPVPLKQLATISVPEPRLIVVQPYDKTTIGNIEKAILQSDLGVTPNSDGTVIRLPIPLLTEERRRELIRVIRNMAEEGRVAIRNIRRDANEHLKELKKLKEVSEDDEHRAEEEMQKKTDRYTDEIGEMLKNKEEETMEV